MHTRRLTPAERAKLALELTMRDTLDGLEEWVSLEIYGFESGCFEILAIERPSSPGAGITQLRRAQEPAKILTFPENRRRAG